MNSGKKIMDDALRAALAARTLAWADDELILGHRDSEWCGHAPILEEDIAFANIALDEIGHAGLWYALHSDLIGEDTATHPDQLVYERPTADYRNAQLVELPNGDWAFSMLRQYLFDTAETIRLKALSESAYTPIAEIAAKVRREEIYHLRHTKMWVQRLGLGTDESQRRMQAALDEMWPYARGLFQRTDGEESLVAAGYVPPADDLIAAWKTEVIRHLTESGLTVPEGEPMMASRSAHTNHLPDLLDDLQEVTRLYPDGEW